MQKWTKLRWATFKWMVRARARARLLRTHAVQKWVGKWAAAAAASSDDASAARAAMKQASPKYVAREWMLVDAYKNAEKKKGKPGNYEPLRKLHQLLKTPYDEHPDDQKVYYRLDDAVVCMS
jgi:uncharacterized protein YdiU (UPF0061 family)